MIPDESELNRMYWGCGMSQSKIASELGVSTKTVDNWMRRCGVKSRTLSASKLIGIAIPRKEKLNQMYCNQCMSMSEIAKEVGVYPSTIRNLMMQYGIEARTVSESLLIKTCMIPREEIGQMYLDHKMSMTEIAMEIGVSYGAVNYWIRKYGIEPRTHFDFIGENSGNWNGGTSFEPYCVKFNNKFKAAVRERDNYICQLCGCTQESNGRKLDVHHIHYDKSDCWPDVVALCRSCNGRVNGDRNYWEEHFERHLSERGLVCWSIGLQEDY